MKTPSTASRDFLLKLELRSQPQLLCAVRGALEPLVESLGFSDEQCRAIVRGVDEAVSNIMRHSYSGQPDQPIELHVNRIEDPGSTEPEQGVEIVLVDWGPPCDPTKLKARSLEEIRPGGLGLHIIRGSMDSVEYQRDGGRNRLRLVKHVRPPKEQGDAEFVKEKPQ
jgi:anti-sigma regulatory factor (Ser/Thr protein kinase)